MAPDFPADLKATLGALAEGQSRNDLAARARRMSEVYRAGGSSLAITDRRDALAYALVRMPATFAAVGAALLAAREAAADIHPRSLLDIGAGPGTASLAAMAVFETLDAATEVESNAALGALARDIAGALHRPATIHHEAGDALAVLPRLPAADLVIVSYVLGELGSIAQQRLTDEAWAHTRQMLVLVEPGTPDGARRIVTQRDRLIASGAHTAAPCPHDFACPLQAPDWCHFTQRLARSRDHRLIKDADAPYEDERFSYVALVRDKIARPAARVLAQPETAKAAITAKLCEADGVARVVQVARRNKPAFAEARRWRWGDAVESRTE
jgi:ribosomal protein RSM22 (predicted rRNA methylase)